LISFRMESKSPTSLLDTSTPVLPTINITNHLTILRASSHDLRRRSECIPMVPDTAEDHFIGPRSPKIELCIVFPGVTDAAMYLNILLRGGSQSFRTDRFRHAHAPAQLGADGLATVCGMQSGLRGRSRPFKVDEHVRAFVFD